MRGGKYSGSISESLIYKYDGDEAAYYSVLDRVYSYKLDVLKKPPELAGRSLKSDSLFWLKVALKYQDAVAAKKFREQYFAAGGTVEGMKESMEALDPLAGLSKGKRIGSMVVGSERDRFIESLTPQERRLLTKAYTYYRDTLGGSPESADEAEAAR